jgi:hypothetical protein
VTARSRPELFEQQEGREIAQLAFVRECKHGAEAFLVHVARARRAGRASATANLGQRLAGSRAIASSACCAGRARRSTIPDRA